MAVAVTLTTVTTLASSAVVTPQLNLLCMSVYLRLPTANILMFVTLVHLCFLITQRAYNCMGRHLFPFCLICYEAAQW